MGTPVSPTGFWFLRHGQTDWNARDLAQGNVETQLNETGRAQAVAAARVLVGRGITQIFSSPLHRARETADVIGEAIGLIPVVVPNLRETSYGIEEGKPMEPWFDSWIDGTYTPDGAETFEALSERAVVTINQCLGQGPGPILIVAHGALFRGLRSAMGLERHSRTPNATPVWCDLIDEAWQLTALKLD